MSTSFSRLGLVAEYGSAWLLPRLIGLPAATEILLSGRTLTAPEAHRLGLVHEVVEGPAVRALEWARQVAQDCSPSSMSIMKSQLLRSQTQSLEESMAESLELMSASFAGPDLPEALAARAERRPPDFHPYGSTPQ
jgi:enoyl-CoA hydratase/carnithine racemase